MLTRQFASSVRPCPTSGSVTILGVAPNGGSISARTSRTSRSIQIPDPVEGQFEGDCPGYQHIGFVVEDVDALRARMLSAGYREGFHPKPHPHHKRVYFIDNDGMEYEFVQYYSDDFTKRNDYDL